MTNKKDFTHNTFRLLLNTLKNQNYQFRTYGQFVAEKNPGKSVVIRHDVDRNPEIAIKMAEIEKEMGVSVSYFFGDVNRSYSEDAIKHIVQIGHELGYHYNDLALAKGDYNKAIASFKKNLDMLRRFYPVRTMCMHGSPLSKWDNRLLWKRYNYKELGIVSEPYMDLDFDEILYLTDASRSWNNAKVTIRDKVDTHFDFQIANTFDIISLLELNKLPDKLLINIHPHNWTTNKFEWFNILLWQGFKNQIKKFFILVRG